jgi:hypothetical protein
MKRYRATMSGGICNAVFVAGLLFASCERHEERALSEASPEPTRIEATRGESGSAERKGDETDYLFVDRRVPRLNIEIPPEGMRVLREYHQVWRQERPERIDVKATVREGAQVYKDVAIHLKGSFTFQPINAQPSLTLNFDKFAKGQRFHGLSKLHLNNTVQDPTYLSEAFARDFFNAIGVPTPRAGHAIVTLNNRRLGLYVLVEGANKTFLQRHFKSTAGNLYDAGSGGEISSEMEIDSGDNREDRSELDNLLEAAEEPDPVKRFARFEELLDLEQFLSFIAGEVLLVHWDGYATGAPNNYRVFHDVGRGKVIFIPHGLDQLLRAGQAAQKLTPPFTGAVARALMSTPEGRRRYLRRIEELVAGEFRRETLLARVDGLDTLLRAGLSGDRPALTRLRGGAGYLKSNIALRSEVVERLLKEPIQPAQFNASNTARLSGWRFKSSNTRPASGKKTATNQHELLQVQARGPQSAGSWRTQLLLETGHYIFTGQGRTDGADAPDESGATGVLLRISGEKLFQGTASSEWTELRYEFDVHGIQDVELVCEYRGTRGSGFFDPASMRLIRQQYRR